jgi:signal transduction histidine kinase
MKRLVGVLRQGDEEIGLAPQPGLADVERLVAQVRDTGMKVDLQVEGTPRPVPLGVDLSAYRIVQEALTNTLKHAGGAPAQVAIRYGERELTIEVTDDGRSTRRGEGGHGLAGMRERVAIFGGTFDAGPRDQGGFAVRALMPLEGHA